MIEFQNVSASYGSVPVLKHISFSIGASELVVLLGKSGSGKSTLLKVIAGLLPPTEGEYHFQNKNVYQLPISKRKELCTQKIGFVWQNYRLIPEITVENNIFLPSIISRTPVDRDYYASLLNLLGIAQYAKQYPDRLSGGEQQRVAMARALILKPDVVLADEPTGALDSATSSKLIDLFLQTREQLHTLFIIATHDEELASIGTRRLNLADGQVIQNER